MYHHDLDNDVIFDAAPAYIGHAPISGASNSIHFYLAGDGGRDLDFEVVNEAAHDVIFQAVVDALQALPNVGNVVAGKTMPSTESFPPTP